MPGNTGITVLGMSEGWSWGLQGMGRLRLGENGRGYRQGTAPWEPDGSRSGRRTC